VIILVAMFLPSAAPLLGMFCLASNCVSVGVVDRLSAYGAKGLDLIL